MPDLSDSGLPLADYVEGLKAELDNASRAGRDTKDIKAELDRVAGKPAKRETTAKQSAAEKG